MVRSEADAGKSLLEAGRWSDARAAFESAVRGEPSGDMLFGLAEALWWDGDIHRSISCYQRAYAAYRAAGSSLGAAWAALSLVIAYKCCLGNDAAASGWLAKAETAADEGCRPVVQGWLWDLHGYLATEHDLGLATELAQKAIDYAVSNGDRDLELVSRGDLGVILVKSGRTEEGFRLIDEAMAGISAGEHSRLNTVVFVCCVMLIACQSVSDLERATQWLPVAEQFLEQYGCPFLYAECRAIYGAVLMARGRWPEAEEALLSAAKLTEGYYASVHVLAVSCLAELRLRQGRVEDAEELLAPIEQEIAATLPLAAIRLARGQISMAMALLERALRYYDEGAIDSVRVMELMVAIRVAEGDLIAAAALVQEMEAAIGSREWPEARARTSMAAGSVAQAANESAAALGHFERAMECFSHLGLRMESARARLSIARVSIDSSPEFAAVEAQGALMVFEELGANSDADQAAALLRHLGVRRKPGRKGVGLLTEREMEVLRLLSSGLSNPEIAERLVISRKTAAHHVSSLLTKLDLRNRAEAVAYATRAAIDG